jgi:hypothetical protein
LLIQAAASAVSTRKPKPPPAQLALRPNDVTATMAPAELKIGPPESPKQVPPPVPGAPEWWML